MATKQQSILPEDLCKLYLRLNGYLTSGFIFHSYVEGRQIGEIDIIGVRFPFHSQEDTGHGSSPYLEIPSSIDVIIGEVKSNKQQLQFNASLTEPGNYEAWIKMLKWLGFVEDAEAHRLAEVLNGAVKPVVNNNTNSLVNVSAETQFGTISIRPIIFSPERLSINNASKFVHWHEINDFLWECLCPEIGSRDNCATRYDFELWGNELGRIIKAYKNRQKSRERFSSMQELYKIIL